MPIGWAFSLGVSSCNSSDGKETLPAQLTPEFDYPLHIFAPAGSELALLSDWAERSHGSVQDLQRPDLDLLFLASLR